MNEKELLKNLIDSFQGQYASLIWNKSLSKCNAQPAEGNYQTRSNVQAVFKEVQANEQTG